MRVRLLTRHAWCALFALCTSAVSAQLTGISTEVVATHTTGELAGHVTYRVYAELTSPSDYISAVYGSALNPLSISTVTDFYQSPFGADFGTAVNASLFNIDSIPETFLAPYDSWLTIGWAPGDIPPPINGVTSIGMTAALSSFAAGGDLAISSTAGGSWFLIPMDTLNPLGVAGPDLRVLLGQFTTDGVLSLDLNVQVFVAGEQENEQIADETSSGAVNPGCSDESACNFTPAAISNDGSCTYPASTCVNCAGTLIDDDNGNGICDTLEVIGCMDSAGCNYSAAANVAGTCTYPEPLRNCAGTCLADADGDDVCDAEEVPGCTDASFGNYNPAATDDDGSCSSTVGCTNPLAANYNPAANVNGWCDIDPAVYCGEGTMWDAATSRCIQDGSAGFGGYGSACFGDFNGDGARGIPDLLLWLPVFENACGED